MTGNERRLKIISILTESEKPVAARKLAEHFQVSRQIIVSDIALLRAEKYNIISTSRGYVLEKEKTIQRVFKMIHSDEDAREEMNLIVDYGGVMEDVFIYHKLYGIVRTDMNIHSRKDVQDMLASMENGKSTFLKNITSGYHYHTISAPSKEILDLIYDEMDKHGFLAPLQEYEPVDFWKKETPEEA